jgi:predicted dehydrogenase/threonine dehydrogenase-like Zn-dependent dehydrogenase
MKQVSQNYKSGAIKVQEVNEPALKSGGVLVKTLYSVISLGTEGMKAREGKLSYLGKAKARPDQVKKVMQSVQQQGFLATYQKVMNKLDSLTPLGYSTSGEVVAVSNDVTDFQVGDRVACAGAGYANHAEVNFIPKNLVVKVPKSVDLQHAAFATVGSIAMQGYRQAGMQIDETASVIGLGLIGQLLVQILGAAGIKVIGVDLDPKKCELSQKLGATLSLTPDSPELKEQINRITSGRGIDCTFLTAGGSSNGPTELAVDIARDRGRVVVIGKTKLDLDWKEYYEKELDVVFSRSYGPGRYDINYEEGGVDYPIGYVRWTERRNLESFISLIEGKKINIAGLLDKVYPFSEATKVYDGLAKGDDIGIGVLFEYNINQQVKREPEVVPDKGTASPLKDNKISLGVIGAGNYASSMLLPHLKEMKNIKMSNVATSTALSGENAKIKFGFEKSTTNYKELLADSSINTVLIATRHKTHAEFTIEAIREGKSVFVEKPLAISFKELEDVRKEIVSTGNDRIQVGFNRRFSKPIIDFAKFWDRREKTPLTAVYRIHAGRMDSNSWYLDASEGTRFIGEGGHFIDTVSYIFNSRPIEVYAHCLTPDNNNPDDFDNLIATITYENGSVATIQYLTQGGVKVPKEYLEVHGCGKSAIMTNFTNSVFYYKNTMKSRKYGSLNKGQKGELVSFCDSLLNGESMPISIDELIGTTLCTLAIDFSLRNKKSVSLKDFYS